MKTLTLAALVVLLAGCVSTTGVVKISEDTYMLAKQDASVWSGAGVKVELYKEANEYCAKLGKKFVQVSNTSVDAVSARSMAGAEIQFKCQ
jgi:uncharacterized lipoprotein YajG